MDEKVGRVGLDDIVATLNKNPVHALGAEPVRRFVEQVFIPQKYEDGAWRENSGRDVEYLFRRSILPENVDMWCSDINARHLHSLLRKLAAKGLSYDYEHNVSCATA